MLSVRDRDRELIRGGFDSFVLRLLVADEPGHQLLVREGGRHLPDCLLVPGSRGHVLQVPERWRGGDQVSLNGLISLL